MTRIQNHQNPQRKTHLLYYTKNILHIMNQRPQLFAKREALYVRCYIEERTVELANYIIKNKCTVREAARKFGISKSTVHTVRVTQKLFISKWRNRAPFVDFVNREIFRKHPYINPKVKNPENRLNSGFQDFLCFSLALSVFEF